jgi:hypothetical protein
MKSRASIFIGFFFIVMLVIGLCWPLRALAVSTLSISPAGEGIFLLQGVEIEDAAALEIIISYDQASLTKPRVVAGPLITGAMTATNPNIPGIVRLAILRLTPVKGSGVIATLIFDRKGSAPGKILSLRARLMNIQGTTLPVVVNVIAHPEASMTISNPPLSKKKQER